MRGPVAAASEGGSKGKVIESLFYQMWYGPRQETHKMRSRERSAKGVPS